MIDYSIRKAYALSKSRKYNKMYIAVDIHDTILASTYSKNSQIKVFLEDARDTLQYLSQREDVVLILYTCSHKDEIENYMFFFEENYIKFKYCNENPEVKTGDDKYGNYDGKFYFNILLDDKAGFNAETDWKLVHDTFITLQILE